MTHQQAIESMAAERYTLGELSEVERDGFEEHYFDCAECAADVRTAELMREGIRATRRPRKDARTFGAAPPAAARRRVRATDWVPWAASAALVTVVGYQTLVVLPDLRARVAVQPISPVVLRPATRGDLPSVALSNLSAFAPLQMDVSPRPGTVELSYVIRRANADEIASGKAAIPRQGMPLILLVPAETIRSPGEYVVVLKEDLQTGTSEVSYRFRVVNDE